jgi:aminoglycoside 6'-N-acetyltransferase I
MSSVRHAEPADAQELARMRAALWPESPLEEHRREVDAWFADGSAGMLPAAILVSHTPNESLTGFLEVSLRSHADGCDPAHPVGYVEGWFVQPDSRGHGAGATLMRAAEDWARAHGAREMASDALIVNEPSELAHRALGFEVVDRCVHLRKPL